MCHIRCMQGYRHFDFVPLSFVIPSEYSDFACELLMVHLFILSYKSYTLNSKLVCTCETNGCLVKLCSVYCINLLTCFNFCYTLLSSISGRSTTWSHAADSAATVFFFTFFFRVCRLFLSLHHHQVVWEALFFHVILSLHLVDKF